MVFFKFVLQINNLIPFKIRRIFQKINCCSSLIYLTLMLFLNDYLSHGYTTTTTTNNNNSHLYSANLYMNIFGWALQYCYIKFMLKVTKA